MAGIGHCPTTNGVVVKCYFKDLKRLVIYPLVNVYITNRKITMLLMGIGFVYQRVLGLAQSWPERIEMVLNRAIAERRSWSGWSPSARTSGDGDVSPTLW